MITPFPVPIQRRLEEINKAVIRTKEKPNFPVPLKENISDHLSFKKNMNGFSYLTFWKRRVQCRRLGDVDEYERDTTSTSSRDGY